MPGKVVSRLQLRSDLRHREVALRSVSAACQSAFPDDPGGNAQLFREHVISAVGEAFNNVALHGYRGGPAGPIEIEVSREPQRLAIQIRDYGQSHDPRTVAPPDLEALPESGLGVYIMTRFMDEVHYAAGRPNVLTLVKRFP